MTLRLPYDVVVDERGSLCPMPVIALARAVRQSPEATVLLLADDPAAISDVPAWCAMRTRVLVWTGDTGDGRGHGFLVAPSQDDQTHIL